ncbi:MAG: LTA synthase family protein, partial [Prevotellaceae bacterium]|nr:LTA synthase family protein [Prevotellaceae bacterium]
GYSASFLHGGDLNFANIRSFIVSQGITDITMDKDFPVKELLTKWGARDEVVFRGLLEQIESETKEPYFKAFLTLSSHEPFDVPTVRFDDPYLNSVFYTDSCLGAFVDEMKKRPDWENTLIVMVPDHNMRYPYTIEYFSPERHHIFMLCIGGTVKNPMIVDKICSQTDIASILLSRLSIPDDEFIFSRNVFSPDYNEFAFYDFPNGFGVVTPEGNVAFDCNAGEKLLKWGEVKMETDFNFHTISRVGEEPDSLFVKGKAYLQYLYKVIDGL